MYQSPKTFALKRGLATAALAVLAFVPGVRAESTNRNEVRAGLERDGWRVVWGKNFTEGDYGRATAAIASSASSGNPAAVMALFEQLLDENWAKIKGNLKGAARKELEEWITQSLQGKKLVTYKGITVEVGFATYKRWQRAVVEVPDGFDFKTGKIRMKKIEKTVPLPNWHQFYIRYKPAYR